MLTSPSTLRQQGMLGMNRRNVAYIGRYNARHLYPRVDNKLTTKLLAQQAGIATPALLASIQHQYEIKELQDWLLGHEGFVIKPAKGSGGKGITVIQSREEDCFLKASGERVSPDEINRHVSNILSGLYSLGGRPDVAMIEELVNLDPIFQDYSYEGIPDIRVIIFQGYPIMAMLRLSTHESDGKANLHQGAIGVGLDLNTGKAISAVQHDKPIHHHPDTLKQFDDLVIPHWESLLTLAAASYDMTGLGYLGADIVLDKKHGPLILELNARPGLAIQVANNAGLLPRLKHIESLSSRHDAVTDRVSFSMRNFGH